MSHHDKLLAAARTLILEQGFTATTARDLVTASNTNLRSIGYHFGSVEALLSRAMEELFDEWMEVVVSAAFLKEDASARDRAGASWKATIATLDEHQGLIRVFVEALAYAEHSPEFRARMREHYLRSQRRVAQAVETALGPEAVAAGASPMTVALFLIAVFDGLAVQFRMAPDATPSGEELVSALRAAVAASLAPVPAPGGEY